MIAVASEVLGNPQGPQLMKWSRRQLNEKIRQLKGADADVESPDDEVQTLLRTDLAKEFKATCNRWDDKRKQIHFTLYENGYCDGINLEDSAPSARGSATLFHMGLVDFEVRV